MLVEHNGALKGATVKESPVSVAKNRVDDYKNCYGAYARVSRQRVPTTSTHHEQMIEKGPVGLGVALGGAILFLFPFPRGAVLPQTFGKEKGEAWGVAPRLSFLLGWFSWALAV